MAFWLNGVIYAALLTLAALAPRAVAPCFHLVFYLSTFRAFLPCLYRLVSHIPYYSIIALVWTLPVCFRMVLELLTFNPLKTAAFRAAVFRT